jgi:hypothetical protein
MGSSASMDYIQTKASAPIEVLRSLAQALSTWFGVGDHNRRHQKVTSDTDIKALCLDLAALKVHLTIPGRHVPPPVLLAKRKGPAKNTKNTSHTHGVRDVLLEGLLSLTQNNMYDKWRARSNPVGEGDEAGGDGEEENWHTGTGFDGVNPPMDFDVGMDPELGGECSFANRGANDSEDAESINES